MDESKTEESIYRDMFSEYPDVVSAHDLCKMLNVSKVTAYKLLNSGQIGSLRIGSVYKIPKIYVLKYLKLIA